MKYLLSALNKGSFYLILISLMGSMGFGGLYLYLGPNLPNVESIKDIRLQTPMTVYSSDGELIAEFGDKRRIPVTLSEVPEAFVHALIATEDKRFYEHSGVDFMGVLRAFVNNITTGTRSQGASTLTQLVARNVYLNRKKTFTRKIREMFLAWKIESEIGKDEILELFLNKAHFSHRAYGLGAAAQVYYGKPLSELRLDQLAVLAGIPKGESLYNPISNPENALKRRNHVLGRMHAEGYIDQPTYEEALAQPIDSTKHGAEISVSAPFLAEMVRREVIDRFGREAAYNEGYRVFTTINSQWQSAAQWALRESLKEYDERHGYRGPEQFYDNIEEASAENLKAFLTSLPEAATLIPAVVKSIDETHANLLLKSGEEYQLSFEAMEWASPFIDSDKKGPKPKLVTDVLKPGDVIRVTETQDGYRLSQIPEVSGGFVALDPDTGAVQALVGGFDFSLNQFNMVTQARRQPGSNIKPFIYSAAMEKGFTAASVLNDAPFVKEDITAEDFWRPKNDSGRYKGPTRLRVALRNSNNSISVRLMNAIGPAFAEDYLKNIGFPDEYMQPYTSLALGSASFTPLEVATGYAAFANGGYKVLPYFIDKVETPTEDIIFAAEPIQVCKICEEMLAEKNQADDETIDEALSLEESELIEAIKVSNQPPNDLTQSESAQSLTNEGDNSAQNTAELEAMLELDLNSELIPLPELPIDESKIAPRVMEERNVFIVNSMMKDVIHRGTAWRTLHNAKSPLLRRNDIGGKTGTTNDAKDAWFSGFNRDVVATAWVGFADYSLSLGNREFGGKAALPIWQRFMEVALRGKPENSMPQPEGIVTARINPESGKLANSSTDGAIFEIFRADHLPEKEPENPSPVKDVEEVHDIF